MAESMDHGINQANSTYTVSDKINKSGLFYDLVKRLYDIKEVEIPVEESEDEYEDDADEEAEDFPEMQEKQTSKATKRKLITKEPCKSKKPKAKKL